VERTCLQCGETWTLEARLARVRAARSRRAAGRAIIGTPLGGATPPLGGDQMMLKLVMDEQLAEDRRRDTQANSDAQVSRQARQVGTCPKCGSVDRYTQRRVS
jgi:hypothetical protein